MSKRRYRWKRIFGLVFTLAVIGIGSAPFLWVSDGRVIPGVTIHGTKAGGATEEELKELFSVKNADLLHGKLVLTKEDAHEEISFRSLSVRYDEKAIEKAMALGRTGGLFQRWYDRWRILLTGHSAAIDASFDEKHLTEDIAQLAGVSHGTVSNVLNGRGNVSMQKILQVEKAAHQLGYSMDERARWLRQPCDHAIGIVLPNLQNDCFATLYSTLSAHMQQAGYYSFL